MKKFLPKKAIVAMSILAMLLTGASSSAASTQTQPRQLSFADRVAYQYAIEEVYWRHRIWPKENPGQKPSLDEVMSAAQMEKKVKDYLRNSQLLASYWQRPITSGHLQAEMERIASQTKQPEVLQELFTALGDDPFLIAECLARPVLSERLVKQCYAHDERIHCELKRRAESELRACRRVEQMRQTSGTYSEIEWIKTEDQSTPKIFAAALQRHEAANVIRMATSEWDDSIRKFAAQFSNTVVGRARPEPTLRNAEGGAPLTRETRADQDALDRVKAGTVSDLQTDDTHFFAMAVVEKEKDRLKLATLSWPKEPFESWAARAEMELPQTENEGAADYTLPAIAMPSPANQPSDCTANSWLPTFPAYLPARRNYHTAVWTGSEMIVWGGARSAYLNTGGRYNPSTDSWFATPTSNAPAARAFHTAIWTGSEMIVWGGNNVSSPFNTGGRYNPGTDGWVATNTTSAPAARRLHTVVWTGSQMIVWGGFASGSYQNTGGRYDPSTDSWTPTTLSGAPAARDSHTAVWTGSQMIVWGGNNGSQLNTGGRYNPGTDSWTATTTTNAPTARDSHTAAWTGSQMIVWGGFFSTNTGGRYNPSTDSWLPTNITNAPSSRYIHTAVWTGTEMIVWGGTFDANTGGRYNATTDSWLSTNITNAPQGRDSHTAVWTGSEMIIWGGYNGDDDDVLNTGGRYNPSTDSWVATNMAFVPLDRSGHTAIWTGTEMIVWGGHNNGYLNTGGRYNAGTDSWTPTSATNAPTGRSDHTAIWTGSEMIVWGGSDNSNSFNTGGKYSPGTDSWVTTNVSNAPERRDLHTAVWTGSEMIVWGGLGSGGGLNTGGRYNPVTNSWAATATTSAATGRDRHTAVWSGSEMIIWGGFAGGNTGGRYNPSSDSWVATNMANSPAARAYHSALWSGSEMIIWGGGAGPGTIFNTGGRYNPGTDSWIATTIANAPTVRYLHTAVWTGSEMIIWGGYSGSIDLNTGGRYDPSTDTWTVTTTNSAPGARESHTAVWTGSEMIVWGGYDGTGVLNSGGRYCAQSVAPVTQSAASRKVHGLSGTFNVDLPLAGTPGIECRTGGATNDYSIVITFASAVTVNGNPQAQVISGAGTVGSGGVSNGGMVTISGNSVIVPLTNVANAQTINVRLNGVTGSSGSGNVTIPMSILIGDTNANAAVNSGDVAQTKARLGQALDATNFRSDVNANGAINAGDVSQIKALLGTGLP